VSSREELIRIVRKAQTWISILLFLGVFLISWKFTNFDIREIELSKWRTIFQSICRPEQPRTKGRNGGI
jgi:ABC-type phosphate/phosphonate transport system permease subunit